MRVVKHWTLLPTDCGASTGGDTPNPAGHSPAQADCAGAQGYTGRVCEILAFKIKFEHKILKLISINIHCAFLIIQRTSDMHFGFGFWGFFWESKLFFMCPGHRSQTLNSSLHNSTISNWLHLGKKSYLLMIYIQCFPSPSLSFPLPEQHLQVCSTLKRAAVLAMIVGNFLDSHSAKSKWDPFHFHKAGIKDLFPLYLLAQHKTSYHLDPRKWEMYKIVINSVGFLYGSSNSSHPIA